VRLLLGREDIDVHLTKYRSDQTALTLALYTGHDRIVDLLFPWYKDDEIYTYQYHVYNIDYDETWTALDYGDIHYDTKRYYKNLFISFHYCS
jgi:hypothetical protein